LTIKGFLQGEKLIKKHRLWELFLTASLGLSSEEVHEEAEKLEHATSDRVLEALDAFLNYPENCPHGQPIPQNSSD
ncbi:MAG: metal-dependent transcriptional regulator, partial [Tissierellia bacterium]|nr:metal-dependent transcriptional regulator [Tissierellia bacterium]